MCEDCEDVEKTYATLADRMVNDYKASVILGDTDLDTGLDTTDAMAPEQEALMRDGVLSTLLYLEYLASRRGTGAAVVLRMLLMDLARSDEEVNAEKRKSG